MIPPLHFSICFFDSVFSERQKGSPIIFFWTMRQKLLDRTSWYNPFLSIESFDTGVFLKKRRLPPHKFWVLLNWNISREIFDIPGFLSIDKIDTGNFLKYRRLLLQKVSSLWDRNCSTEVLDTPSLLSIKSFDVGKFQEDRRVPLQAF